MWMRFPPSPRNDCSAIASGVVREPRVGYGAACLRGIAHVASLPQPPDAVVFMCSELSRGITGHCLDVNCGEYHH